MRGGSGVHVPSLRGASECEAIVTREVSSVRTRDTVYCPSIHRLLLQTSCCCKRPPRISQKCCSEGEIVPLPDPLRRASRAESLDWAELSQARRETATLGCRAGEEGGRARYPGVAPLRKDSVSCGGRRDLTAQ